MKKRIRFVFLRFQYHLSGAEEEIRTPKKRRFKRSMSAVASPRRHWSSLVNLHHPLLLTKQTNRCLFLGSVLVRAAGFEPATSRFRAEHAARLRYTLSHGAGHENCTHTNWLEASGAAVEH